MLVSPRATEKVVKPPPLDALPEQPLRRRSSSTGSSSPDLAPDHTLVVHRSAKKREEQARALVREKAAAIARGVADDDAAAAVEPVDKPALNRTRSRSFGAQLPRAATAGVSAQTGPSGLTRRLSQSVGVPLLPQPGPSPAAGAAAAPVPFALNLPRSLSDDNVATVQLGKDSLPIWATRKASRSRRRSATRATIRCRPPLPRPPPTPTPPLRSQNRIPTLTATRKSR